MEPDYDEVCPISGLKCDECWATCRLEQEAGDDFDEDLNQP